MENAILVLRAKHPSWGARKLKARLEMLQPELVWPAASTFGNILSRATDLALKMHQSPRLVRNKSICRSNRVRL
jgi:hypothetical protein